MPWTPVTTIAGRRRVTERRLGPKLTARVTNYPKVQDKYFLVQSTFTP